MDRGYDVVTAITAEVAACEDTSPRTLPDLEAWISPETLDTLSTACTDRTEPLEFAYLWYRVTVHPNGEIAVTP